MGAGRHPLRRRRRQRGDGQRRRVPIYPASYDSPNIISVAATDHNDRIASFTN